MTAMTEEVKALFKTLKNPRYATEENQGVAPIVFDAIDNGKDIQFIASPQDVMEYGRELWKEAHEGKYGPIGQFNPSLDELKEQMLVKCFTSSNSVTSVFANPALLGTLETANAILARNNGKIPTEGPNVLRFKQVADMWKIPVEKLPYFITNVEDFRFGIVTTLSQFKVSIDVAKNKKELQDALTTFEKELRKVVEIYNFSKPHQPLELPKPIQISGL
jgi:hypothetical protein